MTDELPPEWEYHPQCWCDLCVAYRAEQGGSAEGFVNQPPARFLATPHRTTPPEE